MRWIYITLKNEVLAPFENYEGDCRHTAEIKEGGLQEGGSQDPSRVQTFLERKRHRGKGFSGPGHPTPHAPTSLVA